MDDLLTPLVDRIRRTSRLLCSLTTLALGLLLWEGPIHQLSSQWTGGMTARGQSFRHESNPTGTKTTRVDSMSIIMGQSFQAYQHALLALPGWILGSLLPACSLPTAVILLGLSLVLWPALAFWAASWHGIDIHWLLPVVQSLWILIWTVCQQGLISQLRSNWQTLELSRQVSPRLLGQDKVRNHWLNSPPKKEYLTLVQGRLPSFDSSEGCISVVDFLAKGQSLDQIGSHVFDHQGIWLNPHSEGWLACWREPDSARRAIELIQAFEIAKSPAGERILIHGGELIGGNWKPQKHFLFGVMGETLSDLQKIACLQDLLQVHWMITSGVRGLPQSLLRTRRLGWFQLNEHSKPMEFLEILGWVDPFHSQPPGWTELFDEGLRCFAGQDWDGAESRWRQCMMNRRLAEEHAGRAPESLQDDGPCVFYLEKVLPLVRLQQLPPGWSGILEIDDLPLLHRNHLKKSSAAQSA